MTSSPATRPSSASPSTSLQTVRSLVRAGLHGELDGACVGGRGAHRAPISAVTLLYDGDGKIERHVSLSLCYPPKRLP